MQFHIDSSTAVSGVHSEQWDAGPRGAIATLSNGNGELKPSTIAHLTSAPLCQRWCWGCRASVS